MENNELVASPVGTSNPTLLDLILLRDSLNKSVKWQKSGTIAEDIFSFLYFVVGAFFGATFVGSILFLFTQQIYPSIFLFVLSISLIFANAKLTLIRKEFRLEFCAEYWFFVVVMKNWEALPYQIDVEHILKFNGKTMRSLTYEQKHYLYSLIKMAIVDVRSVFGDNYYDKFYQYRKNNEELLRYIDYCDNPIKISRKQLLHNLSARETIKKKKK